MAKFARLSSQAMLNWRTTKCTRGNDKEKNSNIQHPPSREPSNSKLQTGSRPDPNLTLSDLGALGNSSVFYSPFSDSTKLLCVFTRPPGGENSNSKLQRMTTDYTDNTDKNSYIYPVFTFVICGRFFRFLRFLVSFSCACRDATAFLKFGI